MNDLDVIDAEVVEDEPIIIEPVARSDREQRIFELRMMLDFLEANDDIPLPYSMDEVKFYNIHTAQEAAKLTKRMGGKWKKNNPRSGNDFDEQYFTLDRKVDRLVNVGIVLSRGVVCERKVVGQELKQVEVTTRTTVEKLVDVVEFECGSLLSASEKASMAELEAVSA
jgi:hypothetical protein